MSLLKYATNERSRKQILTLSENIRPPIVSTRPRTTKIQPARAIRMRCPMVKTKHIREHKNETVFCIQSEHSASRDCLMLPSNPQGALHNATLNARNAIPKSKSLVGLVIVNVHHSKKESEIKWELLKNKTKDVIKVTRIIGRKTTAAKLIRLIISSNNQVITAPKNAIRLFGNCTAAKHAENLQTWCNASCANSLVTLPKNVAV